MALEKCGTRAVAAKMLGVPESNFRYYMRKYGIEHGEPAGGIDGLMSHEQIGRILGISHHAVRMAERSAIAKLRQSILANHAYG